MLQPSNHHNIIPILHRLHKSQSSQQAEQCGSLADCLTMNYITMLNPGLHAVNGGGNLCTKTQWREKATRNWRLPLDHGRAPETRRSNCGHRNTNKTINRAEPKGVMSLNLTGEHGLASKLLGEHQSDNMNHSLFYVFFPPRPD